MYYSCYRQPNAQQTEFNEQQAQRIVDKYIFCTTSIGTTGFISIDGLRQVVAYLFYIVLSTENDIYSEEYLDILTDITAILETEPKIKNGDEKTCSKEFFDCHILDQGYRIALEKLNLPYNINTIISKLEQCKNKFRRDRSFIFEKLISSLKNFAERQKAAENERNLPKFRNIYDKKVFDIQPISERNLNEARQKKEPNKEEENRNDRKIKKPLTKEERQKTQKRLEKLNLRKMTVLEKPTTEEIKTKEKDAESREAFFRQFKKNIKHTATSNAKRTEALRRNGERMLFAKTIAMAVEITKPNVQTARRR